MLLMAMTSFVAINYASAQGISGQKIKDMTPEQRAAFQTNMMKTKLVLDTQQIIKVKAVNLKYARQFQPTINSDESRFTRFKKGKELLEKKDNELKGIFTAAQFKQYKDFETEMRNKLMAMNKQ